MIDYASQRMERIKDEEKCLEEMCNANMEVNICVMVVPGEEIEN